MAGPGIRIGVNALYLLPGGVGGTEIYLRSLLAALARLDRINEYFVFTNRETGADIVPAQPNFHHIALPVRAAIRPLRILWEQAILPFDVLKYRLNVLFNPGFTAPALAPCRQVTVFHDLQHKRHPEYFRWFDLPFWRLFLYLSAMRSRSLIADSAATRDDLQTFYKIEPSRIKVVELGVDANLFEVGKRREPNAAQPFVLCVSTLHAHKNLNRLIAAFRSFRAAAPGYRLVIAGLRGFHAEELEQQVREMEIEEAVRFTGWIPRTDLYELFRTASAFIYPSSFEGFGLPVLEALAAGIPTACSAIEPLTTISGSAALHFDPESEDAITEALARVTTDQELRRKLSEAGPLQAAKYSWMESARLTVETLTANR